MLPAFACSELYPWLIVVLSLLGARLVSSATRRTRKIGFAVWMISNGMIGIGFYQTGDVPQGPGVVECVTGEDSCITIPMNRVMQVIWESGYKNAFEQAQKEYFDGLARSMTGMAVAPAGCTCGEDEDDCDCAIGPYTASSAAVDGYN